MKDRHAAVIGTIVAGAFVAGALLASASPAESKTQKTPGGIIMECHYSEWFDGFLITFRKPGGDPQPMDGMFTACDFKYAIGRADPPEEENDEIVWPFPDDEVGG